MLIERSLNWQSALFLQLTWAQLVCEQKIQKLSQCNPQRPYAKTHHHQQHHNHRARAWAPPWGAPSHEGRPATWSPAAPVQKERRVSGCDPSVCGGSSLVQPTNTAVWCWKYQPIATMDWISERVEKVVFSWCRTSLWNVSVKLYNGPSMLQWNSACAVWGLCPLFFWNWFTKSGGLSSVVINRNCWLTIRIRNQVSKMTITGRGSLGVSGLRSLWRTVFPIGDVSL